MKLFILPLVAVLSLAACSNGPETPLSGAAPLAAAADQATEPSLPTVTVYKSPTCGCCSAWADHLRQNGFTVETVDLQDVSTVKERYGIPPALQSCHTAVVDGYVVEGHVPAADVKRLLAERPEAGGLAVPGMPIGSPGMEQPGQPAQPYEVLLVDDGEAAVFARH